MKRLKLLKKCSICFKDNHKTELCKVEKKCFYCKGLHHSALCDKRSTSSPNITNPPRKQELTQLSTDSPTFLYLSTGMTQIDTPQETLLLCKEIKVINPEHPQRQQRTLALFDIGSQLFYISKKLSSQLKLIESKPRTMLVAPFGTKTSIQCPTADARLNIQTEDKEIITINGHVVEYLTQELQVVDIPSNEEFEDLISYKKEPDILIGDDYFFKFIDLQDKRELQSGHTLVQSKVSPMIVGSGYIDRLCNSKSHPSSIMCSVCTNPNLDLENFWKLEMIGIQESPIDNDDEQAMNHLNRQLLSSTEDTSLCTRRLKNLVGCLRSSSLLLTYDTTLKDQLLNGIIEEVPPEKERGVVHYLPHHEVTTPDKTTAQLRIVYDASAHKRGFKSSMKFCIEAQ
ncbi:unnamed protein product [Onchocerca ochengi]|uniref:DUF1758 domain-containing protein n=1 Tax=Onchocerca ochengi TaxID=42157 RepID=A0A182EVN2_ONCOC|nr:unnamed protein product [Onchocerca ochengi]